MSRPDGVQRIVEYAKSVNVTVRVLPEPRLLDHRHLNEGPEHDGEGWSYAPFNDDYALHWERREIVVTRDGSWTGLVHELGHVVASEEPPDESEEFNFLGWEYALVRHLKLDTSKWFRENRDYVIYAKRGVSIGDLTPHQLRAFINERVLFGKLIGLIDFEGRPLAIR